MLNVEPVGRTAGSNHNVMGIVGPSRSGFPTKPKLLLLECWDDEIPAGFFRLIIRLILLSRNISPYRLALVNCI